MHLDQWHLSFNALRSELRDLHAALGAVVDRDEIQMWEVKLLKDAWEVHSKHVLSNFKGRDEAARMGGQTWWARTSSRLVLAGAYSAGFQAINYLMINCVELSNLL